MADMDVIKEVPGYKVILKAVLKSQIQQLVEQLAASTDEESVILTASVSDGTLSHLGSDSGRNFLEDHEDIKSQFLGFCLKRHHIKKQEKEKEKLQREALARAPPVTPPRYGGMGGPQGAYMPQRSPRFAAPHQQGPPHPVALRATAGPMRGSPGSAQRHEPYPTQRPERRASSASHDQTSLPNPRMPHLQKMPSGNGQVIKVEEDDEEQSNQSAPGAMGQSNSDPASPVIKTLTLSSLRSDSYDDSKSSVSNVNDSDLRPDTSIPPGGLSLDSDLSSLINPATGSTTNDSVQDTSAMHGGSDDPNVSVKLEALDEGDMDLEITGVELGQGLGQPPGDPMGSQDWSQGMGMQGGAAGGPGDMAGYSYTLEHSPNENKTQSRTSEKQQESLVGGSGAEIRCPVCGLKVRFQSHLETHWRIHTGEKPFKCEICGKGFRRKYHLKTHSVSHMNLPYEKQ